MADVYTIFWVLGFPQGLYMIMFVASVCDVFVVLNMMCFHIHAKVPRYNQAQAHSSSPQVHAVIDRFQKSLSIKLSLCEIVHRDPSPSRQESIARGRFKRNTKSTPVHSR
jgi:hypothetical protein